MQPSNSVLQGLINRWKWFPNVMSAHVKAVLNKVQ